MKTARFLRDRAGATAIEYAMIAGFIALLLLTALGSIEGSLTGWMNDASGGLTGDAGGEGGEG